MSQIREFLKKCNLPATNRNFKKISGLRVIYAGFHKNATGFYRAISPAIALEAEYGYSAIATCFSAISDFANQYQPATINIPDKLIRQADYLVLGTISSPAHIVATYIDHLRKINRHIKIYMDIDDAIWFLPKNHPMYDTWKQRDTDNLFNVVKLMDGILSPNQEIITSVHAITHVHGIQFPNLWNIDFCTNGSRASTLSRPVFREMPPYRIVMSVNQTHFDSFYTSEFLSAIEAMANRGWATITNIGWDGSMPGRIAKVFDAEVKPATDFLSYIRELHRLNGATEPVYDLAIIPIFAGHRFYDCKAYQKALEFISAGIPVITGNNAVYDCIPCENRLQPYDLEHNIKVLEHYLFSAGAKQSLITRQREALNQKFLIHSESNINSLKNIFTKNTVKNEKIS